MSLGDSIRRFFAKKSSPDLRELEGFMAGRKGIEGYIEPRTAMQPDSLLLVDRDGAHERATVRDPAHATAFCERYGIPVYDAQVIGYPKRMKDYERLRGRVPNSDDLDARFAEIERNLSTDAGPDTPDR